MSRFLTKGTDPWVAVKSVICEEKECVKPSIPPYCSCPPFDLVDVHTFMSTLDYFKIYSQNESRNMLYIFSKYIMIKLNSDENRIFFLFLYIKHVFVIQY